MEQPDVIVGNNLKRLREERNLSYTQLAELTGVSKSMLRQIEVGDSSPTINTLWKIANGLEIPFTMLISPPLPLAKKRINESPPLTGITDGYRLYPLVTFRSGRSFELYYVEVDPYISLDAEAHNGNAEEMIVIIQGTLEVRVQAGTTRINTDELLRFDANQPHHYYNPADIVVRAFMVIAYRL
ncbi:MAG: helix-turn-helix domain-containing protein [Phototrophicaceae bacterium]|jgi:transcriptional regulator with XRE-family HTH domain